MVPVLVLLPKVTLALLPLITPLKVVLVTALAAMKFVLLELRVMALLIVLLAVNNKVPPLMVTLPIDKFVPLVPPVEITKVAALIVVPPV